MNLELLSTPHNHSKSWWDRLFRHHGRIAWDDYDKDYSDLPDQVKRMHLLAEAKNDRTNRLQQAEKTKREALEERDAVRKRARQERLHVLRSGSFKPWVALNRANPPPDKLAAPVAPNQTDRFGR